MPQTTQTSRSVITFSKREGGMPMPHLLDIQTAAFQTLLVPDDVHGARQDVSLERVFRDLFPITDVNEKYKLEFLGYALGEAKYSVEECVERDMTYAAPLKAKLRLDVYEEVEGQKRLKNAIEKEVYLGELPIMTPLGTFVINGAERVVVSQLHRSPGVVFEEDTHPNGQRLFSARIIPFRGSWVEFTIDIHDVIYVHIDKKKKFPATALLRAFGHGNNADILKLFFATKELNIAGKLEGRQEKREVLGSLLAVDVPNPEDRGGEPLGVVGDELTQERLNEMRHKGVKSVTVFARYSTLDVREEEQPTSTRDRQNHVLAFDAADPETGEVLAEGGAELTDALRKKLIKAGVHKVEVLLPAGRSESPLIKNTLAKDPTHSEAEALEQIYALLRPGDAPNLETARQQLQKLFFNPKRYDLGRVGRYKINQRLKLKTDPNHTVLTEDDFVAIIRYLIDLHDGRGFTDDIDHLGNRRIRSVGELIANQFSVGLSRMARLVKERMSINSDPEKISLDDLVNARTVSAVIQAFFGSSQLSQFMDQTNPLAELTNKRRLSALGPGGLTRERAGFEVRDVHYSQYGRMCPVETPEGPNIGLIGTMSTFARVNEMGFLETPYRKVYREVPNASEWEHQGILLRNVRDLRNGDLIAPRGSRVDAAAAKRMAISLLRGQILREDIIDPQTDEMIAEAGHEINRTLAELIIGTPLKLIKIRPIVSQEVDYLSADEEEKFVIVQANAPLDEHNRFLEGRVECRFQGDFEAEPIDRVDYMDVSPKQVVSVSTALIPFLEHDDANRALMGSNMQRQAVPLLRPDAPIVGTGMEYLAARDSGQVVVSKGNGIVLSATGDHITVLEDDGEQREYRLRKFMRSNQDTCINQRPSVGRGQRVRKGEIIADSSSTDNGELALGQNVLVAFIPWEGGNFEDAILVSERLVREDIFTSIHIEKHEVEARDTKLEPEEITRDIPNVGQDSLRNLDDRGIIYVGAEVNPNDILVGKITPKGETDLTAEERLLRAIFGEKAREVKDSSLRVPNGVRGKVIDVKVFARDDDVELPVGVNQRVDVLLCQKRKISAGDKMAGRHGNKGVVSRVLPIEDMPFLPDGTPVDIILNPIGVPSRMNIGQILETHLGWASARLGYRIATPVFDGAREDQIKDMLR